MNKLRTLVTLALNVLALFFATAGAVYNEGHLDNQNPSLLLIAGFIYAITTYVLPKIIDYPNVGTTTVLGVISFITTAIFAFLFCTHAVLWTLLFLFIYLIGAAATMRHYR